MLAQKKINPKFGSKIEELFELIKVEEDWETYVSPRTAEIVKSIYENQSMNKTMQEHNMKYTTVRSHLLRALDRIQEKRTDFKRNGQSDQAQELFDLMDNTPDWKEYVTDKEAELAERYREIRNFYELGRELELHPGNIAGTLYGTTQKIGVVGKIKQRIPQIERRDIDGRREEG